MYPLLIKKKKKKNSKNQQPNKINQGKETTSKPKPK